MPDNNLKIKLVATIDTRASKSEINQKIKEIESQFNKITLQFKIDDQVTNKLNELTKKLKEFGIVSTETGKAAQESAKKQAVSLDQLIQKYSKLTSEIRKYNKDGSLKSTASTYQDESGNGRVITTNSKGQVVGYKDIENIQAFQKEQEKLRKSLIDLSRTSTQTTETLRKIGVGINTSSTLKELDQLKNRMNNLKIGNNLANEQDKLNQSLKKLYDQGIITEENFQKFNSSINSTKNVAEINKVKSALNQLSQTSKNENLQKDLLSQAQGLLSSGSKQLNVSGIQSLITNLRNVSPNAQNATRELNRLQGELKQYQSQTVVATQSTHTFGDMLTQAFTKFPIWMIATTAFFAPITALKQLIGTLYTLDAELTNIKKVLDNANLASVFEDATAAAYKYGQTIDSALSSLGEISKLGFNQQDAEALNNNSMLLATVGEFKNTAEAANYLVAIMRQYKMEVKDTTDVVSALNEVSNKTGADTVGLAQGLSKSSSAAAMAGVNFNELSGMLSSTIETLKIGGNEAGNFYKTLFTRFMRSNTQNVITQAGVQVKDLSGNLRSATDVLADLGKRWDSYSTSQQNAIASALGGVYHINKVSSLLEHQNDVLKNTGYSINSYGSAEKELATFQDGLQYKTNNMIAAFQELAMTIGENGARGAIVTFLGSVTSLTQGFTELTSLTDGWNIKLPLLAAGIYGIAKAFTAVKLAMTGVKASFGWISIGIIAVETIASAFMKSSRAIQLNTQALEDNAKKSVDSTNSLQSLIAKYEELKPQAAGNVQKQQELQSVLKNIQQLAPHLIESTGKYGDALTLNETKADQYIKSLKEMSKEQVKQAQIANSIELSHVNVDIDDAKKKLSSMEGEFKKSIDRVQSYQTKYGVSGLTDAEKEFNKRKLELAQQEQKAIDSGDKNTQFKLRQQSLQQLDEYAKYVKVMKDSSGDLSGYADQIKKVQELESKKKGIEDRKKAIDQLNGSLDDNTKKTQKQSDALSKVAKGNYEATDGMSSLDSSASSLASDMGGATDNIDQFAKSLQEAKGDFEATKDVILQMVQAKQYDKAITASLKEAYSTLSDEISPLNGLLEKVADGKSISATEAIDLIQKEKELAKYISIENGQIKINKQGVIELRNAKIASYQDMINAEKAQIDAQSSGLKAKLKNYGLEIKAILSVAQANEALAAAQKKHQETVNNINGSNTAGAMHASIIEDSQYSGIVSGINEIKDAYSSLDKIAGLASTGLKQVGTEAEKTSDKSIYISDKYKQAIDAVNLAIEKQKKLQDEYPKTSSQYQSALKSEISLLDKKKKLLEDQSKSLASQIASGKVVKSSDITSSATTSSSGYSGTYSSYINQAASKYGVDPNLIAAIIKQESGFKATAKSPVGAMGLMQLMPSTARGLGVTNAYDPYQNIMGGTKYIADQIKAFDGDIQKALAAYNAGAGNVRKYGGIPPFKETQNYVKSVIASYNSMGGSSPNSTSKSAADNAKNIDDAKSQLLQLQQDILDINNQIQELNLQLVQSVAAEQDRKINSYRDDMAKLDTQQGKFNQLSKSWRDLESERLRELNKQKEYQLQAIAYLNEQYRVNTKLTSSQKAQIAEDVLDRTKALYELQQTINDTEQKIAQSKFDEFIKNATDAYDSATTRLDDINKKMDMASTDTQRASYLKVEIALMKERQRLAVDNVLKLRQERSEMSAFPDIVSTIDDEIKKWMDNSKQITVDLHSAYSQLADNIISVYKDMYSQEKDMALKNIDDELNAYKKATDERLKLIDKQESNNTYNKDLASKQKELQDIQKQIDLLRLDDSLGAKAKLDDLLKQQAQKQLELADFTHQRQVDLQKQSLQDSETAREDAANKQKDQVTKQYDDLINSERNFANMREQIMQGNVTNLQSQLQNFANFVQQNMATIGKSISENLLDKLAAAGISLSSISGNGVTFNTPAPLMNTVLAFESGGYTGNSQGIAMLHEKELILNKDDTSNFLAGIKILRPIIDFLKNPTIPNIKPNVATPTGTPPININIQNLSVAGGKQGADDFLNYINNKFAARGVNTRV